MVLVFVVVVILAVLASVVYQREANRQRKNIVDVLLDGHSTDEDILV